MAKLKIAPQAESVEWFEQPLGTFHLKIKAKDSEAAINYRRYLPLIQKFLLLGLDGDSENVMHCQSAEVNGEN